jgi:hypothetical protein
VCLENDFELPRILSELSKEIEAITRKEITDLRSVYILCNTYLHDIFKLLLNRKYKFYWFNVLVDII